LVIRLIGKFVNFLRTIINSKFLLVLQFVFEGLNERNGGNLSVNSVAMGIASK